jgi:hypothetical protein
MEVHTSEQLVPEPGPQKVEIATEKLKKYKLPGSDQIQAEMVQEGGEILILISEIGKSINSTWNKVEIPHKWKETIIVPTFRMAIRITTVIIEAYHNYQRHQKSYTVFFPEV